MAGTRQVTIDTPLGEDLVLSSAEISETLGRLFSFDISLLGKANDIKADDIVGKPVTINIELDGGGTRYFHGIVSHFSQQGSIANGLTQYKAIAHPWFWFLTRTADCRIFQETTVPDIIKEVFGYNGFSDYEVALSGKYRTWEYCVQYRETDFNFLSRLMEQEGIYYFFKHEKGKHILVLADAYNSHEKIATEPEIIYHPAGINLRPDSTSVSNWSIACAAKPGSYTLTDYDFKKPKSDLKASRVVQRNHEKADGEIFDYPGEYVETAEGDDYALRRIEEIHVGFEQVAGNTDSRTMITGGLFALKEHPRADQNKEYLVIQSTYQLSGGDHTSGGGGQEPYTSSFYAIDAKTPFRAARKSDKPAVQGPQTAVVVGPPGEEIYPDEFGRVKVQFHWDRYGAKDENSSCWVRVAQTMAGAGWGAQFLPRIGHEVIIEFLEGDPDRPIITGKVYNADNMPPYGLPDNKTQSGVKTRSSPGGSASNFNEVRMEDKKGSEELYIQAEKDENILVKNNKTENVGVDETVTIGNNQTLTVGNDQTADIGNNQTETVGVDRVESVGSNETLSVGANRTRSVGANESLTVGGSRTRVVAVNESVNVGIAQEIAIGGAQLVGIGAAQSVNVGINQSTNVGMDQSINIGSDQSLDVGKDRTTTVGDMDDLTVGKDLTITAGDSITIKCGKSIISMKKDGTILIEGKDLTSCGSGKIEITATKDLAMKGKKILQN